MDGQTEALYPDALGTEQRLGVIDWKNTSDFRKNGRRRW